MRTCVRCLFFTFLLLYVQGTKADTNFVQQLNSVWGQHNASNVLAFIESAAATNASPDVLMAKGFADVFLLRWRRGATNEFHTAILALSESATIPEERKNDICNNIKFLIYGFEMLADKAHEAETPPSPDPTYQSFMFQEFSNQFPYYELLWEIAESSSCSNE